MFVKPVAKKRVVKRISVSSLMTAAENLFAKQNALMQVQEEIREQLHEQSRQMRECVTLLRLVRYGKQSRK